MIPRSGGAASAPAPDQRGIALVLALFVLVVLGAMVAGTFFAGWLEQQVGENTLFSTQAAEAVDAGLADGLVTITPAELEPLPIGGAAVSLPALPVGSGTTVERQLARLSQNLFLLTARGFRRNASGGALASRAAGLLLHLIADSLTGGQVVVPLRERAWVQLY